MKSAGKARNNGLYRHIRTSKEIIRNLLNDFLTSEKIFYKGVQPPFPTSAPLCQTAQKSPGFSLSIER